MKRKHPLYPRISLVGLALLILIGTGCSVQAASQSFIGPLNSLTTVSTTVPTNGDVNPYGLAQVPSSKGKLFEGQFLVSNFNNSSNLQGTGTTIVEISADGAFSQFAQLNASSVTCPGGIGLTTALVALRNGFVIVGSLPTTDGTSATIGSGCLIVLDSWGNVVETLWGHGIDGPWDMTAVDGGDIAALFVTNVLNGTLAADGSLVNRGTVVRLYLSTFEGRRPEVLQSTVIASGFPERTDPAALVIGPTGVAFDLESGILYVADSLDNRIAAVPNALFRFDSANRGETISQGGALNDPLGLALTPNHHLVEANGDDGNIVEINPKTGKQVAVKLVDNSGGPPPGSGALFGLLAVPGGVYFVDDASNSLELLN